MAWRGPGAQGPDPPEPWPSRVEAFQSACAMFAGQREHDLLSLIEGFAKAGEKKDE